MHQPTLEEDFIDPADMRLNECSEDTIRALSMAISAGDEDPELFRRLSVCLRAVGTPDARLRSMRAIEKAIELDPADPVYRVEKGLTLYARQFIPDALSSLQRAVELDPGCFQAWYHMGRIHKDLYLRDMTSEKDLAEAIRSYEKANAIDGRHAGTLLDLGILLYLKGRLAASSDRASAGIRYHPDDHRFWMLSASVALERKRFSQAQARFDSALARMDGPFRETCEDVSILLTAGERERYANLDGRNRTEFNRKFWVRNDPTPSTPINERRLEHYRRVFLATILLTNRRLGLEGVQTARGMALVRFGLPRAILLDIGSGLDGPFVVW
jgi:GWxTD domain-containing protein